MNRTTASVALLALAASVPAMAQEVTVRLTHDDVDGSIGIGESVTWMLEVAFEGFADGVNASSANLEILGNNTLGGSSDFTYTAAHADTGLGFNGGTNGGTSNGAGIGLVNFTNYYIFGGDFGPAPSYTNPLIVGSFDFTATNTGTLEYSFADGLANSSFVEIQANAFATEYFTIDQVTFNIDTLTIVPAPASALLLTPTVLIAIRRRR